MAQWELVAVDTDARRLTLTGDWGVERAEELHQAFLQAFDGARRLEVDMAQVSDVDLTFFQVICAATKGAADRELRAVNVPDSIAVKAEAMGFSPRHTSGNFWKGVMHGQTHHDRG